ncbi:uncharacterized protein LOC108668079 isoform X2 [Hyalella azteca]|uniref:Uncharacterized protein LOC108668079 isoform X1 n=1 Tax=Hyalella azteca TaxID=294128 RepID=A0A8B7NAU7_HYAAZ|nr:uncharacterized protein LOC108668079 isoform X1 [Hyalella azteca]XP_018010701.2 uncharacterized protein LOC108668079 isoform X2 [Hyalella azteca]
MGSKKRFIAFLLTAVLFGITKTVDGADAMVTMLDAMEVMMTGQPLYDREYLAELFRCMDTFDHRLVTSQNNAWQGMIDYWLAGGGVDDVWGEYEPGYYERNVTTTDVFNMTIYEPCNYASNMATYHPVTEICYRRDLGSPFTLPLDYINAAGTAFSELSMGSSFMHGSHTELGHQLDTKPIAVLAYLIHQGSLSSLTEASSVVKDLSYTPRSMSALQLADEFVNQYMTKPVNEWYAFTQSLDIPDYYLSFAGIFSTAVTVGLPPEIVDQLIPFLANAFGLPDEFLAFIQDDYLPEMRNLTSNLDLGIIEETKFLENLIGTTSKLIYAFIWQEHVLTDNPQFLDPEVNALGWQYLPIVNAWANSLNSFEYFEPDFQNGTNIYPGDEWCNPTWPHAKWHLESAIGLLDLFYLGDEVNRLLSQV